MTKLDEFREKYPAYKSWSDQELADGLYKKYYSDMDRAAFDEQVGFARNVDIGGIDQPDISKPYNPSFMRRVTDSLRSINQGIPYADELVGGTMAALGKDPETGEYFNYSGSSFGDRYDAAAGNERESVAEYAKANPVSNAINTLGGAAITTTALPMARTMAQGAGQGAGLGFLYGHAAGEGGAEDRLKSGGVGAAFGGATGGASVPLMNLAGRGIQALWDQFRSATGGTAAQQSVAFRKMLESVVRDMPEGASPDQIALRLRDRMDELGPNASLIDVGENTRGLARGINALPGGAKRRLTEFVTARQEGLRDPYSQILRGGQQSRISSMLDDLVPEDTTATRQTLSRPTDDARNLYQGAFRANQQMDSPVIRRILKTKSGKEALAIAADEFDDAMKLLSQPDPELTAVARELRQLGMMGDDSVTGVGIGRGLKLETLDRVKKALSDMEGQARRQVLNGTARASKPRAIGNLRRQLTRELDNLDETARAGPNSLRPDGGQYARGRALEAQRLRAQDALRSGEYFLNRAQFRNPQELRAVLRDMTPEELHSFRIGVVGTLKNMAGDTPMTNNIARAGKLFGSPNLERKLRLAFGNNQMFARYIRGMNAESEMFQAYRMLTGGSPTAKIQGELADQAGVPNIVGQAVADTARGNWVTGPMRAIGQAYNKFATRMGMPEPVRNEIAEMLTARQLTPQQAEQLTRNLANMGPDAFQQPVRAMIQRYPALLGAGAGTAAGAVSP